MALADWTAEEMQEAIEAADVVLVDLRAEWCGQCGPQERVLERMLPELTGVELGSVDVGRHVDVADRFGVQTLPALLVFHRGELVERVVGFARAPRVREALSSALA